MPYADDGVDVPLMQLVPNERSILHLTSRRPASWSPSCGRRREAVKQEGCVRRSLLGWTDLGKVSARPAGMYLREARLQVGAVRLGHYEGVTLAVVDAREITDEGFAVNTILGCHGRQACQGRDDANWSPSLQCRCFGWQADCDAS